MSTVEYAGCRVWSINMNSTWVVCNITEANSIACGQTPAFSWTAVEDLIEVELAAQGLQASGSLRDQSTARNANVGISMDYGLTPMSLGRRDWMT
eukprot:32099-Eustigmatos_ZCMA.PRE.1